MPLKSRSGLTAYDLETFETSPGASAPQTSPFCTAEGRALCQGHELSLGLRIREFEGASLVDKVAQLAAMHIAAMEALAGKIGFVAKLCA